MFCPFFMYMYLFLIVFFLKKKFGWLGFVFLFSWICRFFLSFHFNLFCFFSFFKRFFSIFFIFSFLFFLHFFFMVGRFFFPSAGPACARPLHYSAGRACAGPPLRRGKEKFRTLCSLSRRKFRYFFSLSLSLRVSSWYCGRGSRCMDHQRCAFRLPGVIL